MVVNCGINLIPGKITMILDNSSLLILFAVLCVVDIDCSITQHDWFNERFKHFLLQTTQISPLILEN